MSTVTDASVHSAAPAAFHRTRPFAFSIRRELWEHRAVINVPFIAAAVVLFGFVVSAHNLPRNAHVALAALDPMKRAMVLVAPYYFGAFGILFTAFIIAIFYCLSALQNERRDRSILFWKSLPVSDLMTVASKFAIPMVVLPLVAFVAAVAATIVMLVLSMLILARTGDSAVLVAHVPLLSIWVSILYTLVVAALWHAPLYAYLLLISAYARRSAFLWAVLPPLGLMMLETIGTGTNYVFELVKYRFVGYFQEAFTSMQMPMMNLKPHGHAVIGTLPAMDPVHFLTAPGLWLGLVVAAALLAGAVWLRRGREPI